MAREDVRRGGGRGWREIKRTRRKIVTETENTSPGRSEKTKLNAAHDSEMKALEKGWIVFGMLQGGGEGGGGRDRLEALLRSRRLPEVEGGTSEARPSEVWIKTAVSYSCCIRATRKPWS